MSPESTLDGATLDRLESAIGAETLNDIVGLFLTHAPQRLAAAREGAGADDLEAAALALHSLKSSAGMLGANRLRALAERMERLAREDAGPALRALLPELDQAFSRVQQALKQWEEGNGDPRR